jgi:hypothetical protein
MSILQQPFCTLGNLERVGINTNAIRTFTVLQRRDAVKGASGMLEPALRKRHEPPFVVQHDPDFDDLAGMTGGAVPIWSPDPAGPVGTARPMDVLVAFPAGGIVGQPGITFTVNVDATAYGTAPGPAQPFPLSGDVQIGGYSWALPLGATVTDGDSLFYCLRTDAGLQQATAMYACWILLNARGKDPKSDVDLAKVLTEAKEWARSIASGEGDLDKGADATPQRQEGGVRFKAGRAQKDPYGWVPTPER